MSGHSKWATIKHKKGAKDTARGKLFAKLIRQVEVAAREGGGDPDDEPDAAHDVPEGARLVGAARHHRAGHQAGHGRARGRHLRVDHLRGLRARTAWRCSSRCSPTTATAPAPTCAALFSRNGGSPSPSPARWRGSSTARASIIVPRSVDEDELMLAALDAGAEDIADDGDSWRVTTPPSDLHAVRTALEGAGITVDSADVTMVPSTHGRRSTPPRRPSRCCASSTRSTTTTTCRRSTPTSTSPTRSWRPSRCRAAAGRSATARAGRRPTRVARCGAGRGSRPTRASAAGRTWRSGARWRW